MSLKYNMVLKAHYEHPKKGLNNVQNFKIRSRMLFPENDDLDSWLQSDAVKLFQEEEETDAEKSSWVFLNANHLMLRISKFNYKTPSGSSYVTLPPKLAKRKACVNVINEDNKCFILSILL